VITVAGFQSLESTREAEQAQNAERAMEVLADNMNDIQERGAPSRATEISLADGQMHLEEQIQVEIRDSDHGPGDPSFLVNRTFKPRPIVYDTGETSIVYVMGAVFRVDQQGGTVLRSWSPTLEADRTYLPVLNTRSTSGTAQSIGGSTVLVRATTSSRVLEVANHSTTFDDVWINVTSPRRDLWLEMLGTNPEITCSTTGPDSIECQLEYDPERIFVVDTRVGVDLET
jgi:hypothetical protein